MDLLHGLRVAAFGADPPPAAARRLVRFAASLPLVTALLAVVLGLATYASLGKIDPGPVRAVVAVVVAGPIALLPARPLLAWRLTWLGALFAGAVAGIASAFSSGHQPWPWHPVQLLLYPVLLVAVGLRHQTAVVVWVWAATAALIALFVNPANVAGLIVAVTVFAVLGDQVRRRGEAQRRLAAQAELSELEQAKRAVLEERARIARELHDVVAHHMSLIAVRAETAPYRVGDDPAGNHAELAAIATAAREAMTEMRRLLGVLRSEPGEPVRAPQPGLTDVDTLVAVARDAGVPVELTRTGDLAAAPPAVALSAYRVVQEALSNASRHAPGAAVRVRLSATPDAVGVEVANAGPIRPVDDAGSHHGIVGMRERVVGLGGEFAVGPTADGGFTVRATIPTRERA